MRDRPTVAIDQPQARGGAQAADARDRHLRRARRGLYVSLRGTRAPIRNVVSDRVIKQNRILRHNADRLTQTGLLDTLDILPIDQDRTRLHIVKAK